MKDFTKKTLQFTLTPHQTVNAIVLLDSEYQVLNVNRQVNFIFGINFDDYSKYNMCDLLTNFEELMDKAMSEVLSTNEFIETLVPVQTFLLSSMN